MGNWETAAKRAPEGQTRSDWCTPPEVVELVHATFGGPPDLDPCGSPESVVGARWQYLVANGDDGLRDPWFGKCYVNPPFDQLRAFAARAAEERARRACEIIFLMPARTDTKAWHDYVSTADAVCFWRGRMKFLGAKDPCPFPVALPYWGPSPDRFASVFGKRGMVVRLPGVSSSGNGGGDG